MGESKARRRAHHDLFEEHPWCIYCGGPANSVEHMPPKMMFRGKQRPKGLEFPSCRGCNNGTGQSDLIASLLGRAMIEPTVDDADFRDIQKLKNAVLNNMPEVVAELQRDPMSPLRTRRELRRLGVSPENGLWSVDGPLVTKHMTTFAAKLGFALHFEAFGKRVPNEGGVHPMWMTNMQALRGEMPKALLQFLPSTRTLSQGTKHVGDQFEFTWAITEEGENGLFYAQFRQAFAVAAITALDRSYFESFVPDLTPVFKPGDLSL